MDPMQDIQKEAAAFPAEKGKSKTGRAVFHILTSCLALFLLYPIIWLFASSFKESASIVTIMQANQNAFPLNGIRANPYAIKAEDKTAPTVDSPTMISEFLMNVINGCPAIPFHPSA